MLAKLNDINWKALKHAYGTAEDVPEIIRDLASTEVDKSKKALWALYGNIWHQGSTYTATPYVVPFLYELIQSDTTHRRDEIIFLLVNIALGYEYYYLPQGVDVVSLRKKLLGSDTNEFNKYGISGEAEWACYENVNKEIPILYPFINHPNKKISRSAIYALGWFPEWAEESIPKIHSHLGSFSEEKDIANALIAIGLLTKNSMVKTKGLNLKKYLQSEFLLVRVSAAISLANEHLSETILDTLIEGLKEDDYEEIQDFYYNSDNLMALISMTISQYANTKRTEIMKVLCDELKKANAYQSLGITWAILEIINKNREKWIEDSELDDLDELDLMALNAIADYGGWKIDDKEYGNYGFLLRGEGIPDSQEALKKFLKK